MQYVVCYDIADNRRRDRLASILLDYGPRAQESVFMANLDEELAANMEARVAKLVFAAEDPKGGAVLHGPRFFEQPTCHHRPEIARGRGADESALLLKTFFRARRA